MPSYLYRCLQCQAQESRIAGLDDHLAICAVCGFAMVREDGDIFAPYFDSHPPEDLQAPRRRKSKR